jgi:adenine-specific DNA methylase
MASLPDARQAKALGAYYTPSAVADFLVWWAVRSANDSVLDPSFGGGVFLAAAAKRLRCLGGDPTQQVFGIEVDPQVYADISRYLMLTERLAGARLILSDFLEMAPERLGAMDAVIGNPPFVRYQRMAPAGRDRAVERALQQGVRLSRRASLWAAFLIHSVATLKPNGRLAMVIPAELTHASYALPVLDFLHARFGQVTLLSLNERLFPTLSQDVLLLLAEGQGKAPSAIKLHVCRSVADLHNLQAAGRLPISGATVATPEQLRHQHKLLTCGIDQRAANLYSELIHSAVVRTLGDIAQVGIGYVTGANDFFHLSLAQARTLELPQDVLRPSIFRSKALVGLELNQADWQRAASKGHAGYLLSLKRNTPLCERTQHYLASNAANQAANAYKCRTRQPWYCVPNVTTPDAILPVMSGDAPQLVVNTVGAVVPNTLHAVTLHAHTPLSKRALATLWQTSLTRLSTELEGHALGGGLLKLEPSEARQVCLPFPEATDALSELAQALDLLQRQDKKGAACDLADSVILQGLLGLSQEECALLKNAAQALYQHRTAATSK